MATQSWLGDWPPNIGQPPDWALLLFAAVAITLVIILIWRRRRRPASNCAISRSANDEGENAIDAQWPSPNEQASPPPFADNSIPSHDAIPKAGEPAVNDRAIGWRPLYPYIRHRRFTKWQHDDVSAFVDEDLCPLAIRLFISHRWKTPDDPDPDNKSLPTIVEYLSLHLHGGQWLSRCEFAPREGARDR